MTATEVFLDTAYAIALSSPKDEHHDKAVELAEQMESSGIKLITTRPVALEIGNALARQRHREASVALLQSLERDPNVEIVPLTEELYARGFELYQNRSDKEWGITKWLRGSFGLNVSAFCGRSANFSFKVGRFAFICYSASHLAIFSARLFVN